MKTISVIIPFFNEADNLPKIYSELCTVLSSCANYNFQILLMDNNSTDGSAEIASQLQKNDSRVRHFRQSRNFGYQANILSGYWNCTGDAAIQLDADGEDDPQLIPDFIKAWEQGYKVVYGVRKMRQENFLLTLQRKFFYRLLKFLSEIEIPVDAGDFRLLDKCAIEALKGFKEANPYIRGLLSYAGFKQIGVPYVRRPRYKGESKFSWWDYFFMAWGAITSFSKKPLLLINWLGVLLSSVSFILGLIYIFLFLTGKIQVQGFTTIILVFLFFSGVNLFCLGIIASYIGRIFDEVKRRPLQIFEKN